MASAALLFDREADAYDVGFGRNPVGLVFRHVFQQQAARLFPGGSRVLDLGCGTGQDAIRLALEARRVVALDPAPRMIERARAKAGELGLPADRLRFEVLAAEQVGELDGPFDGACSDFGALNCADLESVGRGLARVLRPGAAVLLSLMGPWPLPATLGRALTGVGEARRRSSPHVAGVALPTSYPTPREVRARLGPEFSWRGGMALGVLLPGPDHAGWAQRHPQAFGALAALEGLLRRWPVARGLGDHNVIEGVRR